MSTYASHGSSLDEPSPVTAGSVTPGAATESHPRSATHGLGPSAASEPGSSARSERHRVPVLAGWSSPVVAGLLVVSATLLSAFVLVVPWPLDVPLSWSGDTFQHAAMVQSADWTGAPGELLNAGAPHGVDWSALPSGGERLHLMILSALEALSGSVWVAGTLHLLVVLVITSLASFFVFRWMGVGDLLAGAGALVFTYSPAIYNHIAYGHPFLVGLYPVPLTVYLVLRWSHRWGGVRSPSPPGRASAPGARPGEQARAPAMVRRFGPSAVAVVLIGTSSTYYAAFAVFLSALFGLVVAVRRSDWRGSLPGLAVASAIGSVVLASSLPDLLGRPEVAEMQRKLSDSTRFALNPVEMLLPQEGHPLLGSVWTASSAVAVGSVSAAGLVILALHLVRRSGRERDETDRSLTSLATLAALGAVVGVGGGVGWLIARAGLRELRAWSRISVFIGFCGIAAVVLAVQRSRANWTDRRAGTRVESFVWSRSLIVVALVVVLALFDQRAPLASRGSVETDMREDRSLVRSMSEVLPAGALVLEWPAVSFPDDFGSGRLLTPALLSEDLRFSAGTFRGGPGDWQQSWALEDLHDQVDAAAAGGFDALLIQVDHPLWPGEDASRAVRSVAGPATAGSSQGTWEWYDLRPLRSDLSDEFGAHNLEEFADQMLRPLGVSFSGTPGFPSMDRERDAALGPSGAVRVRAHDGDDSPVVVSLTVRTAEGSRVVLSAGGASTTVTPGPDGRQVVLEVPLESGHGELAVKIDGAALGRGIGRPEVFAELTDVQVFDADLADSPVLVPAALR